MAYGIVNVPGVAGQDLGPLEAAVNAASTAAAAANTKAGSAYDRANAAYNQANNAKSFESNVYGSTELCLGYDTKRVPVGTHSLAVGPLGIAVHHLESPQTVVEIIVWRRALQQKLWETIALHLVQKQMQLERRALQLDMALGFSIITAGQ